MPLGSCYPFLNIDAPMPTSTLKPEPQYSEARFERFVGHHHDRHDSKGKGPEEQQGSRAHGLESQSQSQSQSQSPPDQESELERLRNYYEEDKQFEEEQYENPLLL